MKITKRQKKKKKDEPLKIRGDFNDVLKVAVSENPIPKKKVKKK